MNNEYPLVSVIITSYNRENFIGKAIESVLEQDYPNFELIISDNCSTDNSDAVIRSYVKDKRIKYFRNDTNIGMIQNFQKTIEQLSTGEYLTFVSSDDYLINQSFITEGIQLFSKYTTVAFVKASKVRVKNNSEISNPSYDAFFEKEFRSGREMFFSFLEENSPIGFSGCLLSKKFLKRIDVHYDPEFISLEHEILLKLLLVGDVGFIKRHSYAFRIHGMQESQIYSTGQFLANLKILERVRDFSIALRHFQENSINRWYQKAIYESIRFYYIRKYCKDFDEFDEFINQISRTYPKIIKQIDAETKIKLLKMIYNRRINFLKILKLFLPRYYMLVLEYRKAGQTHG